MAARISTPIASNGAESRAAIEDWARVAVAGAQPSLGDILSLWPADQRERIVLWAVLGPAKEVALGARFRDHAFTGPLRALVHELKYLRGDVPVVVEMHDGRTIVMALAELTSGGERLVTRRHSVE